MLQQTRETGSRVFHKIFDTHLHGDYHLAIESGFTNSNIQHRLEKSLLKSAGIGVGLVGLALTQENITGLGWNIDLPIVSHLDPTKLIWFSIPFFIFGARRVWQMHVLARQPRRGR